VVYRARESWWEVVRSTDADSAEDELEELTFRVGEYGKDVLKTNFVKDRVKPLPSRNPKTRVANRVVPGEGSIGVKRLPIIKNVVDILIRLNSAHLEQSIGESVEIAFTTFGPIERLPEVANLTLSTIEDRLDAGEIFECGDVLKRLETGGIVDAFDRRRGGWFEDAVVDVLCALAEFHGVEVGFEECDAFAVEFRQRGGCRAFFTAFLLLFEAFATRLALLGFLDDAYRLGVSECVSTVFVTHRCLFEWS
jgi:hypothetical protein